MELAINRDTLPNDGQKIKWQTQKDIDNEIWKEGTFSEGDDLFCEGFNDTAIKWDLSWSVLHWETLK
ncbi:MAG: hypothetical protein QM503_04670 [Bacteroidota bacterium]